MAAATAVKPSRILGRHEELAAIGGLHPQGLNREAFTDADLRARLLLLSWAEARRFEAAMDDIGNLFVMRRGEADDASPVVTGSHIDSQPAGGPYDGQYGVLAAFEALEAMDDAGITSRRPAWMVVWANEEGSRFQPTTMGSAVFAGQLPLEQALAATDANGVTVGQELARLQSAMPVRRLISSLPFEAYVEAHIEQGPILDQLRVPVGIVTSIQGLRWFTVRVTGETGHAGTTPDRDRRDALVAAVAMINGLRLLMHDAEDTVRFTVGRFDVRPNSPNTIPEEVLFTVDFRHPAAAVLAHLGDQVRAVCEANAMGCSVTVEETLASPPTRLDATITEDIRRVSSELGYQRMDIVSGATHDSRYIAQTCPAGMLFIPCRNGLSHSVLEHAEPDHMVAGARVLAGVVATLTMR